MPKLLQAEIRLEKLLKKLVISYGKGRMTQKKAKSHGESFLGSKTES